MTSVIMLHNQIVDKAHVLRHLPLVLYSLSTPLSLLSNTSFSFCPMSPLSINEHLSTTGTVGLAGAGVLGLLMAKYPDRAIFDEYREGIPHRKGVPLLGLLPIVLSNRFRLHDFQLDNFESLDSMTVYVERTFWCFENAQKLSETELYILV